MRLTGFGHSEGKQQQVRTRNQEATPASWLFDLGKVTSLWSQFSHLREGDWTRWSLIPLPVLKHSDDASTGKG